MCARGIPGTPDHAESARERATRNREFSASLADDVCRLDGPPTRAPLHSGNPTVKKARGLVSGFGAGFSTLNCSNVSTRHKVFFRGDFQVFSGNVKRFASSTINHQHQPLFCAEIVCVQHRSKEMSIINFFPLCARARRNATDVGPPASTRLHPA